MTLTKLSLRNARNQMNDYLIYFITIVIAAALIFAFNSLVTSGEIQSLSSMMQNLSYMIVLASIVVVFVIGWLINYTMRFMLTKRSRELGTYVLLGIEPKKVSKMFFVENLAIGLVALFIGIWVGNLIFHALRAVILRLFEISYTFQFSLSLRALALTIVYFAGIYLFALLKSRRHIRKMKIYDLIYFEKQNETEAIQRGKIRKGLFILSLLCGGISVILFSTLNMTMNLIAIIFFIVFLFGFFTSFSSSVPTYFNKRPEKKYRRNNLLIFRSLSSKLSTIGITIAVVSLLFTGTLVAEGSALIFNKQFRRQNDTAISFDLFISSRTASDFDVYAPYLDENIPIRQSLKYDIYTSDDDHVTQYLSTYADYWSHLEKDAVLKYSDYAALRQMLGYEAVTLAHDAYLIHCMDYLKPTLDSYDNDIVLGGTALHKSTVCDEMFTQASWDGNGRGFIIVVPDHLAPAQPVLLHAYAAMSTAPVNGLRYEGLLDIRPDTAERDFILSKAAKAEEAASNSALILFPLFYLAFVFMMVAATILTIHLLSDTAKLKRQYQILYNLGMDRREMKQSLNRQFALFYAMPTLPAFIVCVSFLTAFSKVFDPGVIVSAAEPVIIILAALLLFLAIYIVYIIASYKSLKREVLPEI